MIDSPEKPKVVVGITGASGARIGIRVLELLQKIEKIETHLVVTSAGAITIKQETNRAVQEVQELANVVHKNTSVGASIASGSANVHSMLITPCSINTMSAIAYGVTQNLVTRAGDVCLKEGRPLLLMLRETPLHQGHIRTMGHASEAGAIIAPPVPAFYRNYETITEMIDDMAKRALIRVGLGDDLRESWPGIPRDQRQSKTSRMFDSLPLENIGQPISYWS